MEGTKEELPDDVRDYIKIKVESDELDNWFTKLSMNKKRAIHNLVKELIQ